MTLQRKKCYISQNYGSITNSVGKLQFDAASPPNPLPHRGWGISNLYLLRF